MAIDPNVKIGQELAREFIKRAELMELKGKKRNDVLMDYWCGAVVLAMAQDPDGSLANYLGAIGALSFAPRGYKALVEYAEKDFSVKAA